MASRQPSPEIIRQSLNDLRSGNLPEIEHETRVEILERAWARVQDALPSEVRDLLDQYPPQLIEGYALLMRWKAEQATYPDPIVEPITDLEAEQKPVLSPQAQRHSSPTPTISQSSHNDSTAEASSGQGTTNTFHPHLCQHTEEEAYLSALPLIISQGCYSGPIRKFHAWRTCIGTLVGITLPQFEQVPHGVIVHLPPHLASEHTSSPLLPLLELEVDGGTLTYEQCTQLLPALENLVPRLVGWPETTRQFIAGLQQAINIKQGITCTM